MDYSAKTTLPLNSIGIIYPLPVFRHLSNWYNLFTHICFINGGENIKGSNVLRFWRLMPKGEKILSPKQNDRTTAISKIFEMKDLVGIHKDLFFNWYLVIAISSIGIYIQNWYLLKPS
jgi:hypothetical protein